MKKIISLVTALCLLLLFVGCFDGGTKPVDDPPVYLNMNTDYPDTENLQDGGGKKAKVILLLGQSNASGCSINSYLLKNIGAEKYSVYENGFPSVLINYCIDDHNSTSNGNFVKVDLTCGATGGFFGPEVGIAEKLSSAFPDETVFILKYTMSGYSLHSHWFRHGEKGSIYDAFLIFVNKYMETLISKNYDAAIGAVCWMQGESDTSEFKASKYYDNQVAFVNYLRADLAKYADGGKLYFIDAGISNSPYCEPAYPEINDAKLRFSALSPLNIYFSTISEGLTVHLEPEGEPDWGHYDSLSGLKLGHLFGDRIIDIYKTTD